MGIGDSNDRELIWEKIYVYGTAGDATDLIEYEGWAQPGTPTSAAKWKIKKFLYSSNGVTNEKWANNDSTGFNYIWDSRATYF